MAKQPTIKVDVMNVESVKRQLEAAEIAVRAIRMIADGEVELQFIREHARTTLRDVRKALTQA